jgi:uncharacterized protein YidB (DUF937 family)
MSELQIALLDARQDRRDPMHHDPNEKRSARQLIGVGKLEAAPVIELERVERCAIASHGARCQTRTGVSGLLSLAGQEEHGWQRQTMEFYDALNQVLYRYLRGLGLGTETTEDVIQETFLRLTAHLRDGGNAENLRSWIFQVAYNLSMDVHRASHRDLGKRIRRSPLTDTGPIPMPTRSWHVWRMKGSIA